MYARIFRAGSCWGFGFGGCWDGGEKGGAWHLKALLFLRCRMSYQDVRRSQRKLKFTNNFTNNF